MHRRGVIAAIGLISILTWSLDGDARAQHYPRGEQQGSKPAPSADQPPPSADQIARFVDDLADESFQVRRQATIQLTLAGAASKQPVMDVLRSDDPEVRRRARQILSVVLPIDLRQRLADFAADRQGRHEHQLPGWARYRELIGKEAAARDLFVSMSYAETDLLISAENAPSEIETIFIQRCIELRNQTTGRGGRAQTGISIGSLAGLFFVATNPDVRVNARWASYLNAFSAREPFATAVTDGDLAAPLRKLVSAWFDKGLAADPNTNYQNMIMALRFDMPLGLRLAKSLLAKKGQNTLTRPYAMLAIGKFGDDEDADLLTPFLDDETPCARYTRDSRQTTVQVRDVALAILVHMSGQSHAEYGFADVVADTRYLFNIRSLGFADPAGREQAIRVWKEQAAVNP